MKTTMGVLDRLEDAHRILITANIPCLEQRTTIPVTSGCKLLIRYVSKLLSNAAKQVCLFNNQRKKENYMLRKERSLLMFT